MKNLIIAFYLCILGTLAASSYAFGQIDSTINYKTFLTTVANFADKFKAETDITSSINTPQGALKANFISRKDQSKEVHLIDLKRNNSSSVTFDSSGKVQSYSKFTFGDQMYTVKTQFCEQLLSSFGYPESSERKQIEACSDKIKKAYELEKYVYTNYSSSSLDSSYKQLKENTKKDSINNAERVLSFGLLDSLKTEKPEDKAFKKESEDAVRSEGNYSRSSIIEDKYHFYNYLKLCDELANANLLEKKKNIEEKFRKSNNSNPALESAIKGTK